MNWRRIVSPKMNDQPTHDTDLLLLWSWYTRIFSSSFRVPTLGALTMARLRAVEAPSCGIT